MALIGQHQQTAFANPQNGQAPDADVIRANDNAVTAKHNAHDADATIHVQTGLLSARPAAGTAGAVYVDENRRFYVDNGSAWAEVPYARLDAAGTNVFTNNVEVGGALNVGGTSSLGTVNAGAVTATSVTATTGLTVLSGGASITGYTTVTSGQAVASQFNAGNLSGSATISWNNSSNQRAVVTGPVTISFSNTVAGGSYTLVLVQDGVGGRAVTFSGVRWEGGAQPSFTTSANNATLFSFYHTGTGLIGVMAATSLTSV